MTTHEAENPNRLWMLRAARGEIDTPAAHNTVQAMHMAANLATTDPELHAALMDGDQAHPDHPRWPDDPQPWLRDTPSDPATNETFDELTGQLKAEDSILIDWPTFWNHETPDELWLLDNVIALGRAHAIYAAHKQGKSLFALWACLEILKRGDTDILYLDYEMTETDLRERLEDMGCSADTDLEALHYALLPSLLPLDSADGAADLLDLVSDLQTPDRHLYVVIDTTGRAVAGDENSNDTIRDFYRWTGSALKRQGITWTRLDHAGKDPLRGQRGGSAKGDDVDIIWKLIAGDNAITLHRDASRMSWVPEKVVFSMTEEPLEFVPAAEMWPAGTADLCLQMTQLGLPIDATYKQVREAGIKGRKQNVLKALKFRRNDLTAVPEPIPVGNKRNQPRNQPQKPAPTSGSVIGNQPEPEPSGEGVWVPHTSGEPPHPVPEPIRHCSCGQTLTDPTTDLCAACLANPGQLPPLNRNELF